MARLKQLLVSLTARLDSMGWLPLLAVRVALGLEFIASGRGKLFGGLPELIEAAPREAICAAPHRSCVRHTPAPPRSASRGARRGCARPRVRGRRSAASREPRLR